MAFHLDNRIDVDILRTEYEKTGRVRISPLLKESEAEQLRVHLLARTDWQLRIRGYGSQVYDLNTSDMEGWPPEQIAALRKLLEPHEQGRFSFTYRQITIVDTAQTTCEPNGILSEFGEFLSGEAVTAMVRGITQKPDIAYADCFASRYDPGDYLTAHDDRKPNSNRLAAYVFGLTKPWRVEWGGVLLFHGKDGQIENGQRPDFNVFDLFAVPRDHSVSYVAPFTKGSRMSITGWFRSYPTGSE